jgi:hypothetical protein
MRATQPFQPQEIVKKEKKIESNVYTEHPGGWGGGGGCFCLSACHPTSHLILQHKGANSISNFLQ